MSDSITSCADDERWAKEREAIEERDRLLREERLSTMTRHQQIVNGLADAYNTAIQSNGLQGFFERLAARLLREESSTGMSRAQRDSLISRVEAMHLQLAELRAALLTK